MVALLAEGVDRNRKKHGGYTRCQKSPSSRRAWIEILRLVSSLTTWSVALLAEGVDRNWCTATARSSIPVSPSSRRAWIEIAPIVICTKLVTMSPSSRRAWIEILQHFSIFITPWSPSSRRAWIEIRQRTAYVRWPPGRPPRGGRG